MKPTYEEIDEALLPFHLYAEELTDIPGSMEDEELGIRMRIEEIQLEMPLLLEVVCGERDRELTIGAAPPVYDIETGIESVYHRIRLSVRVEETGQEGRDRRRTIAD